MRKTQWAAFCYPVDVGFVVADEDADMSLYSPTASTTRERARLRVDSRAACAAGEVYRSKVADGDA